MSHKPQCDCLNECGDDPDLCRKAVEPCQQHKRHLQQVGHRQIDHEISTLSFGEKITDHLIGQSAYALVEAHRRHDSLLDAVEEVQEAFPELAFRHLVILWIGINAKARS